MEIVEDVLSPWLKDRCKIYVHCINTDSVLTKRMPALPALLITVVLGHISVLETLEERFILFLVTDEAWELGQMQSPVVILVTSSCLFEV